MIRILIVKNSAPTVSVQNQPDWKFLLTFILIAAKFKRQIFCSEWKVVYCDVKVPYCDVKVACSDVKVPYSDVKDPC